MRFRTKILLVLIVVGVLPALIMGWLSFRTSRDELRHTVGRHQILHAKEIARYCYEFVQEALDDLRAVADYIPFDQLGSGELTEVLEVPYRQLVYINILATLDEHGNASAAPVYNGETKASSSLGHEPITEGDLEVFSRNVPFSAAIESGASIGPPYRGKGVSPRLAVAIRTEAGLVRVLAAELSLLGLQQRMEELTAEDNVAYLFDSRGSPVAHGERRDTIGEEEERLVATGLTSTGPIVRQVRRFDGEEWLAAFAPVGKLGWGIVVAERASIAFRAADRVRLFSIFWAVLALVLTIVLGVLLARGLSRPIRQLSTAAVALTKGSYEHRVIVDSSDEIGQFAEAFNSMAKGIQRRDDEIRRWNQELQQRIEDRTAQLKAAQDQILRSRRLTALGSLSAGLAHELNNPMTGIMGLAGIVRKKFAPESVDGKNLSAILEQSERVMAIITNFQRFAEQEIDGDAERFSLAEPVRATLSLYADGLQEHSIELATNFSPKALKVRGDPTQVQRLVANLVQNAIETMNDGGVLTLSITPVDDAVQLRITDTGRGISPENQERIFDPFFSTKAHQTQVGMGLAVCHSIVQAHNGQISVQSKQGRGTTFTVMLPAAPAAAHLY